MRYLTAILYDVERELAQSKMKHSEMFNGAHEGYAVILEELDELWDDIKLNNSLLAQRKEAIQVAAMAVKYVEWIEAELNIEDLAKALSDEINRDGVLKDIPWKEKV